MAEPIVIRADDDSVVSGLMEYITEAKASFQTQTAQLLLDGHPDQAIITAARGHELDCIVDVIKEIIEEQTKGNGDEPSTPTRISN